MPNLDTVEDTLFVPMLGRLYATQNFPHILNDQKALELKDKLPEKLAGSDTQTQYTLMASAVRSVNMDYYIKDFMERNPNGVIVNLGCGLETTYYRNNNDINDWYEVDLENVIKYRKTLLNESKNDKYIIADAFSESWIKQIRQEHPTNPILLTASGLFYYFERDKVVSLLENLKKFGSIEIIFDAVNMSGMKQMGHYMEQVGHEDAKMFFYVDSGLALGEETGTTLLSEEPYYAHNSKKGLKLITKITMKVSDMLNMVKMVHMKLN